jgi:hypothetical protein
MKKILYSIAVMIFTVGFSASDLRAQMDGLHGDDRESRIGVHAGNLFRTSFFNDGTFGGRANTPPEVAGEWPINSGHLYLIDGNPFVGSEVLDNSGNLVHILSENKSVNIGGSRGDQCGSDNHWCTFLPLPGFANPNGDRIAMARGSAEVENSWPAFWPDKFDNPSDPGWRNDNVDQNPAKAAWNGYFGKNVFNADEESYFVADDYENKEFDFTPDAMNPNRGGLGIRMYVRGFQWSKAAVEDALFCLFDLENIGTYRHDKMVFGYKIGNNIGDTNTAGDGGDDNASFDRDLDFAFMWDNGCMPGETGTCTGGGGYGPVGFMGGAFLESPGNPYDGIDNDNDSNDSDGPIYPGPVISTALWQPKTLSLDEPIVLIDYASSTFNRTVTTLRTALQAAGKGPGDTLEVRYGSRVFKYWDGKSLDFNGQSEIGDNLVDDNLNGVIDESRGAEVQAGVTSYLYVGYKYINYFTGEGLDNPLLDERRDDGEDNDGDWDARFDDVGADGLKPGDLGYPGPDFGEGNGIPTSGEPHFDKTDIDETDMLGLTSFNLYEWTSLNQYDDENYWNAMAPGFFSTNVTGQNVELLYASGYFPLVPNQIERFSMAILCGINYDDIVNNKRQVATAYNQNYNFAKAPYVPTVRAIAGDKRVTLFWDDFAETSLDPITGRDFEGYRIYRSTDPSFRDNGRITDARFGSDLWSRPIAQFDLNNGIRDFAGSHTQGVLFWLGEDTGLRHYWVDTTAVNGFTYFYAVTAYDHGSTNQRGVPDTLGIDPSECSKFVAIQASGEIEKGSNVVVVRPEAPAAGFIPADFKDSQILRGPQNTAQGTVGYAIVDPARIAKDHRYQITFTETLTGSLRATRGFTLLDLTSGHTVIQNAPLPDANDEQLSLVDSTGFTLSFSGNPATLSLIADSSGWSRTGIPAYQFVRYTPSPSNRPIRLIAGDFRIVFSDVGIDTSKLYMFGSTPLPAIPVNFTVLNTLTNQKMPFGFRERHSRPGEEGIFSFNLGRRQSDEIIFLANPDSLIASWVVRYTITSTTQPDSFRAGPGDVLTLKLSKPFLSHDTYEFTTRASELDQELAKADMQRIRVVPNPYIATNSWEPSNPYSSGRGERVIHFTHLPTRCTIKIFNVRGQLVNTLEHDAPVDNGTEVWNMLSKDNLEISYGIYFYHIKAEGVGEKSGKFVVIK